MWAEIAEEILTQTLSFATKSEDASITVDAEERIVPSRHRLAFSTVCPAMRRRSFGKACCQEKCSGWGLDRALIADKSWPGNLNNLDEWKFCLNAA